LFTSPHLVHPRERIVVDGNPVDDGLFCAALEQLRTNEPGVLKDCTVRSMAQRPRVLADLHREVRKHRDGGDRSDQFAEAT
jgi:hypothetical protein